ncbi:hypothetical protein QTN47_12780 [Danxiaibacter flavus]|uniref:Uncharacterized protein n=1 Tax=Danxiaibacter flavus TaxID=3049108 RepID=A0ABV3ZFU2_9BACT|nr:hypothetical protein QNM32_12785 [Chitinophagaceae bacterium DXS]
MLRKTSAILLLTIFCFNLFGYRVVFEYFQHKADRQLVDQLDRNEYSEEDLITLSVPLSLPYQTNWKEFERVDGEIEVNGKIYKYVKRKVANGEMVLKCLPDHQKMRLESARDDFFKYANDFVQSNSKKSGDSKPTTFKLVIPDYDAFQQVFFTSIPAELTAYLISRDTFFAPQPTSKLHGQPPEWA